MIKNDRQYRITKAQAEKFKAAVNGFSADMDNTQHPLIKKAQHDALSSQLEELETSIYEYENLKSGKYAVFEQLDFNELPVALIRARIASGLSQRELAEKINVKEQQIQRYEANYYAGASLERISKIIEALGISVKEDIFLPSKTFSLKRLFEKLLNNGIDKELILNRIIPVSLRVQIEESYSASSESSLAIQVASCVSKIFGWKILSMFDDSSLNVNPRSAGVVRFKKTTRAEEKRLSAYTIYAHTLALLTLEATKRIKQNHISIDPIETRSAILDSYGKITFETALHYVWDLGIPVLPLTDPGAFHGACWRVNGRNVIVLKQTNKAQSRWLFDLLHELFHAGQNREIQELCIIEENPIEPIQQDSEEEEEANYFAEDTIFAGRSAEIEEMCAKETKGDIKFLKNAVKKVAAREAVEVDALANHMAYRLASQGTDWWGAANNIQKTSPSPADIAVQIFFEKSDLNQFNNNDRLLLVQALSNT